MGLARRPEVPVRRIDLALVLYHVSVWRDLRRPSTLPVGFAGLGNPRLLDFVFLRSVLAISATDPRALRLWQRCPLDEAGILFDSLAALRLLGLVPGRKRFDLGCLTSPSVYILVHFL